jgi:RNA polymerase sigma-70 factor (ECF subfamily)
MSESPSTALGLELAPGLRRLAARLASQSDADDLVQAAYLRALEHDGEVSRRSSWLRRVLLNERNMAQRSSTRRTDREQRSLEAEPSVALDDVVHALEIARMVETLIEQLDPALRKVVRARYFEDCSSAEIASREGIPAGTVRWRLKEALDRLRDALDQRHGGERRSWAAVLAPLGDPPTLVSSAASDPTNVDGAATATAKGTPAMTKIVLAATMMASAGVGVAYFDRADADMRPTTTASEAEPRAAVVSNDTSATVRERWTQRRAAIQLAHARASANRSARAEDHGAGADLPPAIGGCTSDGCMERISREIDAVRDGCDELLPHPGFSTMMTVYVIGSPEHGAVVEAVEFWDEGDSSEALRECVTESMYGIDLGPAAEDFARSLTTGLGNSMAPGPAFDAAQQAEIDAAFAESIAAGHDGPHIIRIGKARTDE